MSRTLFWYIFKDLVRIFMLTSGALAGIMSFGGLLRPLTRQGLDVEQVVKVLTYLGPAMTTYSFPIAALFATTVVYGRLSSDNELTGCRAGGISLVSLSVAGPALVLGLLVASISLLFLCFVVPSCTLRVEKVLYSNFAQLISNHIERTHEIDFGNSTIFAQQAWVPAPDPNSPNGQQQVVLRGPTIVSDDKPDPKDPSYHVPKDFSTAAQAVVFIDRKGDDDEVYLTVRLDDGFRFPRKFESSMQAGVKETVVGPILIPSPIKEDTKFMDVWHLKRLFADPFRSAHLREEIADLIKADQSLAYLTALRGQLNGEASQAAFAIDANEQYLLQREPGCTWAYDESNSTLVIKTPATDAGRPVAFRLQVPGRPVSVVHARDMKLQVTPDVAGKTIACKLALFDCTTETAQGPAPRASFTQQFTIAMPADIAAIATRGLDYYERQPQAKTLRHDTMKLGNQIIAECHNRASFAISCLILVMVGCALGMIFRSGNFLTAFAVSFVPALLSITLTIAGQRTAGNVPYIGTTDPLMLGLSLIWTGNVVNLILASILLLRLHRQ